MRALGAVTAGAASAPAVRARARSLDRCPSATGRDLRTGRIAQLVEQLTLIKNFSFALFAIAAETPHSTPFGGTPSGAPRRWPEQRSQLSLRPKA